MTRPLPLLLAICTLGVFVLSEWSVLQRAFGSHRLPYVVGLSAAVICAYARVSWEPPLRGAIRAVLASWVGSVAGYLATLASFYAEHHRLTPGVELHLWLLVTMVWAYLRTDGWSLGLALMLPSLIVGICRGLWPAEKRL